LREVLSANPNLHGVRPFLAMCLSRQGQHDAALAELNDDVKRTASVDPDIAYAVASVYALEKDSEQAFDWLQRSVALGNENRFLFEHDRNLTSLREDPGFKQLLARIQVNP
jgi:thioredoxin-like negative regulator of GroEL